jgi:hypothetical protein
LQGGSSISAKLLTPAKSGEREAGNAFLDWAEEEHLIVKLGEQDGKS